MSCVCVCVCVWWDGEQERSIKNLPTCFTRLTPTDPTAATPLHTALEGARQSLQSSLAALQAALDAADAPPPPVDASPPLTGAALATAASFLARRLAFTAHAPAGWAPGAPLGMCRPPAPQPWQLAASSLRAARGGGCEGQGGRGEGRCWGRDNGR